MAYFAEDSVFFPVIITEFLVILIINAVTIAAFARINRLRKRSTYLTINLTVTDLLVGAVAGPLHVYHQKKENLDFTWPGVTVFAFDNIFPIASQVNLCLISLDRPHATLYPFRHCLIRKCFYFKIILVSWFISFLLGALMACLKFNVPYSTYSYVWTPFSILTLVVLVISYVIIILNVQRSPHSQNHGSIQTERKLSVTLFIVTGVSILTILPWSIYDFMPEDSKTKWGNESSIEIYDLLDVLYYANSIVNPLVYAIRLQEFRKAIGNLVSRQNQAKHRQPGTRPHQNRDHSSQADSLL